MSLTEINGSDISPHLRKFIDDIVSMTSNIVLKRNDIADTYEDAWSITLSGYYKSILEGKDSISIYDKIPTAVYYNMVSWKEVGAESQSYFPPIVYGKLQKSGSSYVEYMSMTNPMYTCYIGYDEPTKDLGTKYDGYIKIIHPENGEDKPKKLLLYKYSASTESYILIKDETTINFTDDTDENSTKINFSDVYCEIQDGVFTLIKDVDNKYILEDGEYIKSDIGTYYYNPEYALYYKTNTFDQYEITSIINSKYFPEEYISDFEEEMKKYVINTYVKPELSPEEDFSVTRYFGEYNTYYRQLNGLPPISQMDTQPSVIMNDLIPEMYVDKTITKKLYDLTDDEVDVIKTNGKYDELLETYPSASYLKYMGRNRIDVITAREAERFEILRIGPYDNKSHYDIFIKNFHIAKEYVLRRFYNPEIFYSHEYYGSYIAYMIVCQTMCQSIARSDSILLNYLYSDEDTIRLRLQSYGLNVFDDIPLSYRKNISKYIENLIRNKGTDSIYPLIMDIFNIDDIEVYKYFYRRIKDSNGNVDLSMAQVPIGTKNFISEIVKDSNRADYDDITSNDIYWGSYGMPLTYTNSNGEIELVGNADEYLKNIITNNQFNYMNSKYISINGIFNLSKLNFNASYLMNYLLEWSKKNPEITLSNVDGLDGRYSLFILMVTLFAIQAKRLRYDGNIQHDAVSVAYVMKYNLSGTITKDGKEIKIIDLYKNYYSEFYYKYMIETMGDNDELAGNDKKSYNEYKEIIDSYNNNSSNIYGSDVVTLHMPNTISINNITESYLKNSSLGGIYDTIVKLREDSDSYKEYECYNELLKAIAISRLNNTIFKLSSPRWIEIDNFVTWIEVTDNDIKSMVLDTYNNLYLKQNLDHEIDFILCVSHGYPDLSLGEEYSEDKIQYCIDQDSLKTGSLKVYIKKYVVCDDAQNLDDDVNIPVGNDNVLYVVSEPDDTMEDMLQTIDLSIYDHPYCYNKTSSKLYMYLKYARTYQEYLKYENLVLYNIIQPEDSEYYTNGDELLIDPIYYERLGALYTNIVSAIENKITDENLKNIINVSFSDLNLLSVYLKKVINVFKSFEVDIATINIIYEINDPNKNRVKIIDDMVCKSDETHYDHFHIIQDLSVNENTVFDDAISIRDELNIEEIGR